jgi:hypothetical protein
MMITHLSLLISADQLVLQQKAIFTFSDGRMDQILPNALHNAQITAQLNVRFTLLQLLVVSGVYLLLQLHLKIFASTNVQKV